MKKETCLVSASGKTHSNFLSRPSCHFKVISNFYAPEGEGKAKLQDNMISAKNTKHFAYGTDVEKSG